MDLILRSSSKYSFGNLSSTDRSTYDKLYYEQNKERKNKRIVKYRQLKRKYPEISIIDWKHIDFSNLNISQEDIYILLTEFLILLTRNNISYLFDIADSETKKRLSNLNIIELDKLF